MRTFLLAAAVGLVLLTACQPQSAPTAALMPPFTPTSTTATAAAAPTLTPILTLAAPVVSYSLPEPVHNQPSFKPVDVSEGPVTVTPVVELPTATPGPTFTPPPPPPPTTNHFWFYRPIAEGGIVWTNKIYPYGSTRGGTLRPHHGVEFDVPYNTEILAANEGTIIFAGPDSDTLIGPETNFYGNVVVIQHGFQLNGQNVYSLYGHLSQIYVTVGQAVKAREIIALSGATGVADGPHLHFEVRVEQNSYNHTRNPTLWLLPFPERGVVAGRVVFPNGALAYEAPITLRRIDAPSNYAATTTYASETLNPDDHWQENFAFDDVYAGYYEVVVTQGDKKYKTEVWVYPNQTSFVEIVIFPEIQVEETDAP